MPPPLALPLADAQRRLGKPGRPPLSEAEKAKRAATRKANRAARLGMVSPRLLDLEGAARYIGCSSWTLRDMIAAGTLPRVRVPLPGGGELRKILVDREDLARFVESWKDRPAGGGR